MFVSVATSCDNAVIRHVLHPLKSKNVCSLHFIKYIKYPTSYKNERTSGEVLKPLEFKGVQKAPEGLTV